MAQETGVFAVFLRVLRAFVVRNFNVVALNALQKYLRAPAKRGILFLSCFVGRGTLRQQHPSGKTLCRIKHQQQYNALSP
ncbi:MAG: hypothetical protein AAFN11_20085, partial [Chloroflexota bacterium]